MIGKVIHKLRKRKGLTQKGLCEKLDITLSYLSMIENSKANPSIKLTEKMSKVFEVPVSVMFFFTITEKDIPKEKVEVYKVVMPRISNFFLSLFDDNVKSFIDE